MSGIFHDPRSGDSSSPKEQSSSFTISGGKVVLELIEELLLLILTGFDPNLQGRLHLKEAANFTLAGYTRSTQYALDAYHGWNGSYKGACYNTDTTLDHLMQKLPHPVEDDQNKIEKRRIICNN